MTQKIKDFFQISPFKITFFVILVALLLFLFDFGFLRLVELKTLDLRIASRGVLQPGGETVIAVIDEKSLSELGRWPWPRTILSQLVDKLKASGAKAIGFDIVFSEPDENSSLKTIDELSAELRKRNASNSSALSILTKKRAAADTDTALARSISHAQNVSLGYFFHFQGRQKELDLSHIKEHEIVASAAGIANSRYPMINSSGVTPDDSQLPNAFAPEANIKALTDAAQNSGFFNAIPDSDGSYRWSPLVIKFRDNYYFPLSMAMVQQYLDWPQLVLNLEKYGAQSVKIGDVVIPTDESGRLLINYLVRQKPSPITRLPISSRAGFPRKSFKIRLCSSARQPLASMICGSRLSALPIPEWKFMPP